MAAWQEAVKLKQAEEYRLLYVAMTRAKRLLWMSAAELGPFRWSVFRADQPSSLQQKKPCPVLPALVRYLKQERGTRGQGRRGDWETRENSN